jgi:hypothetical protein
MTPYPPCINGTWTSVHAEADARAQATASVMEKAQHSSLLAEQATLEHKEDMTNYK